MATVNEQVFGLKMSVRNLDAIVANFHKTDTELQGEFVDLAEKYAAITLHRVRGRLPTGPSAEHPYSTGFRSEQLEARFSPTGLVFEVGWWREKFVDEPSGRGIFYPPYPEFGTVNQAAHPTLQPAADETNPEFEADIRAALRRVTRRYSA